MDRLMVLGPHHSSYIPDIMSIICLPEILQGKIKRSLENKRLQIPIHFHSGSFGIQCQLGRDIWRTGASGFCNPGVSSQSHPNRWKGLCDCKHDAPFKKSLLVVPEFGRFETLTFLSVNPTVRHFFFFYSPRRDQKWVFEKMANATS